MQPAICLLSVVPVRSEPSHRSEMVSQILFGEYVTLGEEKNDFVAVKCLYDGYEGWVQSTQLTPVSEKQILTTSDYIGVFAAEVFVDERCRMVPFGAPVYCPEKAANALSFGNRQVSYNLRDTAVWRVAEKAFTEENLQKIISVFLDTPYLWGGKSVFGIDCSGFVQLVFKMFGVNLLRDAYLQASQGTVVETLEEAMLGDLLFFQNEKGKVIHVGILLGNNEVVHASGNVRVDVIDREGIINKENGKRTHRFHSIRRFF